MFIIWKKISKAYLRNQGRMSPGRDYQQSAYILLFQKDRALLDNSNIYLGGIIVKIKYNNPQRAIEALSINVSYFNFQFYGHSYLCIFPTRLIGIRMITFLQQCTCHLDRSAFTRSESSPSQIRYFLSVQESIWKADTRWRGSFPDSPRTIFISSFHTSRRISWETPWLLKLGIAKPWRRSPCLVPKCV